jgi:hypothetical protein
VRPRDSLAGAARRGGGLTVAAQGTGMGEGKGNKDVSDQIEDEEQLLGTKNEKKEDGGEVRARWRRAPAPW